ncbi:MAG: bile acid:sodium symporter [Verrucomicrobiota bacterium]
MSRKKSWKKRAWESISICLKISNPEPGHPFNRQLDRFLLPTGLLLALFVSLSWPGGQDIVRRAAVMPLNPCLIFTIFLISGLRLKISHLLDEPLPAEPFAAVTVVQFLTAPLCALLLGLLLPLPEAWFIGLAAICCVPTTLSSGIVLTAQAEGNEVLALVLTLLITLLGTLLTPMLFSLLLGVGSSLDLAESALIQQLFALVLLPLVTGQLLRLLIVKNPPAFLKHVPSICVILTVWLAAQGHAEALRALPAYAWICFLLLSLVLHVGWFAILWFYAEKRGIHRRIQTAMAMVGSQKTLPFAVTILTHALASNEMAERLSIAIAFAVVFHLTQILTDSLLAPRLVETRWIGTLIADD